MSRKPQSDYDSRRVDYSLIHGESKEILVKFTNALQLKDGARLLDVGGGYGSMLINILETNPSLSFQYDLLDNSLPQIETANKYLAEHLKNKPNNCKVNFLHQNASDMRLEPDFYDVVVCKMFIHEVPLLKKEDTFSNILSVMKPGGSVYFWSPDLETEDHRFYTSTIMKKDELANFNSLARNRHFLLNSELIGFLSKTGFKGIEKLFDFDYDLHTSLRLKSEFKGDTEKIAEWHRHILEIAQQLAPELRSALLLEVADENIHIRFKRAVHKAVKP